MIRKVIVPILPPGIDLGRDRRKSPDACPRNKIGVITPGNNMDAVHRIDIGVLLIGSQHMIPSPGRSIVPDLERTMVTARSQDVGFERGPKTPKLYIGNGSSDII